MCFYVPSFLLCLFRGLPLFLKINFVRHQSLTILILKNKLKPNYVVKLVSSNFILFHHSLSFLKTTAALQVQLCCRNCFLKFHSFVMIHCHFELLLLILLLLLLLPVLILFFLFFFLPLPLISLFWLFSFLFFCSSLLHGSLADLLAKVSLLTEPSNKSHKERKNAQIHCKI